MYIQYIAKRQIKWIKMTFINCTNCTNCTKFHDKTARRYINHQLYIHVYICYNSHLFDTKASLNNTADTHLT